MPSGDWKLLTVEEVAEIVGIGQESVRVWLRTKQLRGVKFSNKAGWRIRPADLQKFLDARDNRGGPPEEQEPQE
jgi:excisionase family DNA binding protein